MLAPVILSVLINFIGRTVWAAYTVGRAFLSEFVVTFVFVYKLVETAHNGHEI